MSYRFLSYIPFMSLCFLPACVTGGGISKSDWQDARTLQIVTEADVQAKILHAVKQALPRDLSTVEEEKLDGRWNERSVSAFLAQARAKKTDHLLVLTKGDEAKSDCPALAYKIQLYRVEDGQKLGEVEDTVCESDSLVLSAESLTVRKAH